ncbi:MAG: hypothetical protein ABI542_02105 [Gemmatimonadota bacterium]
MRPDPHVIVLLATALAGCASALPGPQMPSPLASTNPARIASWVNELRSPVATETRFDARFQEGSGAEASLRGAVVIVPPDSLRFDARGPLGSAARAVFVVGDSAIWAEPEEEVTNLVPEYDLLWALVGQARAPKNGDELSAESTAATRAWRYVRGADTVNYLLTTSAKRSLVAEVRRAGELIGRVYTTFDADGKLARAQLDVPSRPARLTLTFRNHRTPDSLPASLWTRPGDAP